MDLENKVIARLSELGNLTPEVIAVKQTVEKQKADLAKEVEKFCKERGEAI